MIKYHVYFLCLVGCRFQKDQWEFWREVIHSISLLSMSSSFPLYALRMTPFRPPGQPCGLRMWAKDVTLTHKHLLRASSHVPLGRVTHHPCFVKRCTASQISGPAHTMPALKEGFSFSPRNQRSFWKCWGSHWLPVCVGMCKCNQHVYVNLRFAFMHLDALSVYMLWERPTVCAEYSQEEHTIKR